MTEASQQPQRRSRRRWWRWLLAIPVLLTLALCALGWLLGHLDTPWVKARVQRAARSSAHLDIDYASARVRPFSGASVEQLVIRSPERFRPVAPELLRLEHLDVSWSRASVMGRGPKLERVVMDGLKVNVVADESGFNSVSALEPPAPAQKSPPPQTPPSHELGELLAPTPPARQVQVSRVSLTYLQLQKGRVATTTQLENFGLDLEAKAAQRGWLLRLTTNAAAPWQVSRRELEGGRLQTASLGVGLDVVAHEDTLQLSLDARVLQQSFVDVALPPALAHVELVARFDPAHGTTEVTVERSHLAAGAVGLSAHVTVQDKPAALQVDAATLDVALKPLAAWLPPQLMPVELGDGALHVHLQSFSWDESSSAPTWNPDARVTLAATLEHVRRLHASGESSLARAELAVDGRVGKTHTFDVDARLSVEGLELRDARRARLFSGPAHLALEARELEPPTSLRARGRLHATWDLGPLHGLLDLQKHLTSLDFSSHTELGDLSLVRRWDQAGLVPPRAWTRMALAVDSAGTVSALTTKEPSVDVTSTLVWSHPAIAALSASSFQLKVHSRGNAWHQELHAEQVLRGGVFRGHPLPATSQATLDLELDRRIPHLRASLEFLGAPKGGFSTDVQWVHATRTLQFQAEGRLSGLESLGPLLLPSAVLETVDLSELALTLKTEGTLSGVLRAIEPDGTLRFVPHPSWERAVTAQVDLGASGLHWEAADQQVDIPSLSLHGALQPSGHHAVLSTALRVEKLHLELGAHAVDLGEVRGDGRVELDRFDPSTPASFLQHLSVAFVQQDFAPAYPLDGSVLTLEGTRSAEGALHLETLRWDNAAGGTALQLTGNLDLGTAPQHLSLKGGLRQDVAKVWRAPERFLGRGQVEGTFRVDSPDLAIYRLSASLKLRGLHLQLPGSQVQVDGVNGEIPLSEDVVVGPAGVRLLEVANANPYWMLRFADQHPLLAKAGFLSIARVQTPWATLTQLVGSMKVEQNVLSLSQLELGVRGGRVTGQFTLTLQDQDSSVLAHVRATHVLSSHDEPFDGNAAFAFSLRNRSLEGRAEVLRIGKRHLLDLLDLQDPRHADSSINRIRTALDFGYPERMRVVSSHGFANVHLQLGGLARFITIDDMRGIPMGPLVDRMLTPPSPSGSEP